MGADYNRTLAINFVQGIANRVTQSVVNGFVADAYIYEQVQGAFVRVTRGQRETEMQRRLKEREKEKVESKEESVTKTLLEVQAIMMKMMLDNQRMMAMMLENQSQTSRSRRTMGTHQIDQRGPTYYSCG